MTASAGAGEPGDTGLILFELGGDRWALPLSEVAEVGEPGSLRRIPGAAAPVVGLAECRGKLLTVIDLARLLEGQAPAGPPALILLTEPRERYALYLTATLRLGKAAAVEPRAVFVVDGVRFRGLEPASLLEPLLSGV